MNLTTPNYAALTMAELIHHSWCLQMSCGVCNRRKIWPYGMLKSFPGGVTVEDLAKRLRCDGCGSGEGHVIVVSDRTREPFADQRMDGYREVFPRGGEKPVASPDYRWVGVGATKR